MEGAEFRFREKIADHSVETLVFKKKFESGVVINVSTIGIKR